MTFVKNVRNGTCAGNQRMQASSRNRTSTLITKRSRRSRIYGLLPAEHFRRQRRADHEHHGQRRDIADVCRPGVTAPDALQQRHGVGERQRRARRPAAPAAATRSARRVRERPSIGYRMTAPIGCANRAVGTRLAITKPIDRMLHGAERAARARSRQRNVERRPGSSACPPAHQQASVSDRQQQLDEHVRGENRVRPQRRRAQPLEDAALAVDRDDRHERQHGAERDQDRDEDRQDDVDEAPTPRAETSRRAGRAAARARRTPAPGSRSCRCAERLAHEDLDLEPGQFPQSTQHVRVRL